MDKRLIFLIVGILLIASLVLVLKKCSSSTKIDKPLITISPREIKEGDSIVFKDETKGAVRWKWNFGDGELGTTVSGSHHYISAGTYPVVVEVWGNFGKLTDTSVKIVVSKRYSDVATAVFAIDGPTTAFVGDKVTFSCNTANVKNYHWRFDETGRTDTTKSVVYSFVSPGNSRVNLHVIMNDNSQGDKFVEVVVKNKPVATGGGKPAPKKSAAEIEADIQKTLNLIADPSSSSNLPPEYNDMIQRYFCGNQQINVDVNGRKKDIYSYCMTLLVNKDAKIAGVKAVLGADNCVQNLVVNQK